jgi:predicted solute-binding protein
LYLLIGYRHGFNSVPYVTDNLRQSNGELLIGDKALDKMRLRRYGPDNTNADRPELSFDHITDLAEEWYGFHRLPFVFARWVILKDAPAKARTALEDWLAEFQHSEKELLKQSAPKAANHIGVPVEDIMDYFRVIRRTLDTEDIAGQELFLQEIQKHNREPLFEHV